LFTKPQRKGAKQLPGREMTAWMYPTWQRAAILDTLDEAFLDVKGCIIASSYRFGICPLEVLWEK
jgi:hypothetical protein